MLYLDSATHIENEISAFGVLGFRVFCASANLEVRNTGTFNLLSKRRETHGWGLRIQKGDSLK